MIRPILTIATAALFLTISSLALADAAPAGGGSSGGSGGGPAGGGGSTGGAHGGGGGLHGAGITSHSAAHAAAEQSKALHNGAAHNGSHMHPHKHPHTIFPPAVYPDLMQTVSFNCSPNDVKRSKGGINCGFPMKAPVDPKTGLPGH